MDPFNKLPPELREEILIATNSKRSILQLIRASPTMLGQYVHSKKFIEPKLFDIDAEFDDDMLNDAIAIIRFPRHRDGGLFWPAMDHEELWLEGWFVSTWKKDRSPIEGEISRLYHRLVVFVRDYLTKATAACPAREYWCLPHQGGQLTFKDRAYEVISKFCYFAGVKLWLWCHRYYSVQELLTGRLRQWEKEAIVCVEEYLQSLYRAVLIQCGNSQLPETSAARHISHAPDAREWEGYELIALEYIESEYYGRHKLNRTLTLNLYELCQWLACFGLDLATIVVQGATGGQHARAIVGEWLKDLAKRGPQCGFFRSLDYAQTVSSVLRSGITFRDHMQDWSGVNEQDKYLKLYRSRAWVFLDDARLFKSDGEGPHFPADDIVFPHIRFNDIIGPRLYINLSSRDPRAKKWTATEEARHLSQLLSLQETSTVRSARSTKDP
ncbi:hypothetical protein F5B22DRAFT_660392 [Xylaria bambusicola]|uniref:uncharacterized protein n=1 Tax=Xylaria bambusicola TaxID=326684 RepID=UPI00200786B4|nr:uncharacterized protein F5B22DRAFT_660392 [Xylaria bambusicola]KAI0506308.1 hypothetical protein F5B22DRAFT_660392 [Xylaria bambusicola]